MNQSETSLRRNLVDAHDLSRRLPGTPPAWMVGPLLNLTGLAELNQAYSTLATGELAANPFRQALEKLRIRTLVNPVTLEHIPRSGPTILVANHPFGGADGLTLGALSLERRRDTRVLVNSWLGQVDKLVPWLIQVDVFDAKRSVGSNAGQLRCALRHLRQGGLLVVFPAGTVSRFNPIAGRVEDAAWSAGVAMLARLSGATVVPCYFSGKNRPVFHLAGLIHSGLGTALLPRELVARQDGAVSVCIGRPVRPEVLQRFADDAQRIAWLRLRTYDMQTSERVPAPCHQPLVPLAPALEPRIVATELACLPEECCLVTQGSYRVYFAQRRWIPQTVAEIGRLREVSFRAVGEGTGTATDLDRFDNHYYHLVLWDEQTQRIVGAYRLAFCDEALRSGGLSALYSHTLFRYRAAIKPKLLKSIELGRSFIRPEYQKRPLALAMLWRGIGEVLCRNPAYRCLVGPVSISQRYRGAAQRLLLSYLNDERHTAPWRDWVTPRRPVAVRLSECERRVCQAAFASTKEVSALIGELDEEGKRIPVLIDRYLELGAKVLGLSRDPDFGDCVDALVLVDLDKTPQALLRRFMGPEGATRFLNEWKLAS